MGWDGMESSVRIRYISPIYIIQFANYGIISGIYTFDSMYYKYIIYNTMVSFFFQKINEK